MKVHVPILYPLPAAGLILALSLAGCSSDSTLPSASAGPGGGEPIGRFGGVGWGGEPDAAAGDSGAPGPAADGGPTTEPIPTDNSKCIDLDGDGHGYQCIDGADCDDGNPNFTTECPDCTSANHSGCPCVDEGATALCFGGDATLVGIGECLVGERACSGGYWTACQGEVTPAEEACDGKDNDCDGQVDEGVLSECGNCDPFCHHYAAGPGSVDPFVLTPETSEAVEQTPEGWVTLSESSYKMRFIWIANSSEGTVSKLDTDTGNELGRYVTCGDPSRTSVDKNGDCWVGCRGDGKVAKIRGAVDNCADLNGNGVVETSTDLNGDGTIQPGEMMPAGQDECIQFIVKPYAGGIVRALGVDAENHAWAGYWNEAVLVRIAPADGALVTSIQLPANPYGLAIDSKGLIWVAGRGGNKLVRVDPATGQVDALTPPSGCFEPYGIAIDEKDRIWTGNCCCGHVAWMYDPSTGGWGSVAVKNRPRGIASNKKGLVFVANDESSAIARIDTATMTVTGYAELGAGRFPVGIAVDSTGSVWAVNQSASSATKVDPDTMAVVLEHPVGTGPYTYSDMTGQFFFQDIAPEGYHRTVYGGWEGFRVAWESLTVEYDAPPGTSIKVRVRSADSAEKLAAAEWSDYAGPYPPEVFPLAIPPLLKSKKGNLLEVEVSLYTESEAKKPVVKGISVTYSAQPQ